MNLEKLNQWLTLIANFGVLIGIFVVAIQLQQTQTEMKAESSTIRAEMLQTANNEALTYNIGGLTRKIDNDEALTEIEDAQARTFINNWLRFLENLHYQNQLGVLDDEIWQGQQQNFVNICNGNNQVYNYLYPEGLIGTSYRPSFVELMNSYCGD